MKRGAPADGVAELWADARHAEALLLLDEAIGDDPDDGALHAWRALTLVELRRTDEAAAAAARAEWLAPDDWLVRLVCGDVALHRDDLAVAERQVAWALARDPEDADALVLAARVRAQRGDWRGARSAAQLALSYAPQHEGAAVLVALSVEQRADVGAESTATAWAAVAGRFPANAIARTRLGWAALHAGDGRKARDTFETALILDPSDDAARDGLVAALASGAPLTGAVLGALRWIAGLGAPLRVALWGVIATTIVVLVVRDAATTAGRVVAMSTATTLAALVLLQWLATPMIDAVALLSARGRELVRGARRRTALAASALLVAGCAVTAALVAWHGEPRWAQGAALGVLVSAAALGRAARD